MAQPKQQASQPRKGMNRDKAVQDLNETEYTFSLNSNIASEVGDTFFLQDEPSNLLCNNFPDGFLIVGREFDVNTNRTYYLLSNPETSVSQIGYISNINNVQNADDLESDCNCNIKNILAEPLETQQPVATCTYTQLAEDSCNLCLNFSINRPIRKIIIKYETTGTSLWWTDNNETLRYFQVDDLEQYFYTGNDSCGEDTKEETCLDCEKLRVFKQFEQPEIQASEIQQGGNLKAGVYEALISYSDLQGNEISSYYSITNPVSIFDENNTILQQNELEYATGFGIRFKIEGLDISYPYYKVAVVYTGAINGTTYYSLGTYSTSNSEVSLTTLQGLQTISISRLLVPKKVYEKAEGLAASNGTLFWHGTTEQEEINFQPLANLLGSFVRWQTVETTENLYKDGVSNSRFKSFLRDEVYPLAIQLEFTNGFTSADFPLISRPANSTDLQAVSNTDTQSILEYATNCSSNDRNKRWQFYNTATDEGFYEGEDPENYNLVDREIIKQCTVTSVATEENLEITIDCSQPYTDIFEYIESNRADICNPSSSAYDEDLCDILSDTFPEQTCEEGLFDTNCDSPAILVEGSEEIYLDTVGDEQIETVFVPLSEMSRTPVPNVCYAYKPGSNPQGYENDTVFEDTYMSNGEVVYKRSDSPSNTSCAYATEVLAITEGSAPPPVTNFLQYEGTKTAITALQTSKTSVSATGGFTNFLHTSSLWTKVTFGNRDNVVLEISKSVGCGTPDDIPIGNAIRMTTYTSCSVNAHTASQVIDLSSGALVMLNKADYPSGTAYIAIDAPINTKTREYGTPEAPLTEVVYIVSPPCGCYALYAREPQCSSRTVTVTDAVFSKRARYSTICEFKVPVNTGCEPAPYRYGKFGYWESELTYPDNAELYNSNTLSIDTAELGEYADEFEEYFIQDGLLNADFRCQPIRHYRFPDYRISPFMSTEQLTPFSDSFIYPIGVTIDENLINFFLDTAVQNSLMTQEQRDKVSGYKIKAGDRTLNKSIIAKGLANDMFRYAEPGATNPEQVLFPNFPYNDLSANELLYTDQSKSAYIQHPFSGNQNYDFTLHSPETSYGKPVLPAELKIEAYQFGFSRGHFVSVEDHVKQVILGKDAYQIATTLGTIEAVLEQAITVGEVGVQFDSWFTAGTSSGTNAIGSVVQGLAIAALAVGLVAGLATKIGQYRKQWLDIIYDLGQPRNFASYYTSVGKYNYTLPNTTEGNMLRAIKTKKYLKPGSYQFTEEFTGETIKINNRDRESSVYLSTGSDYPIVYPTFYKSFDNSRLIASEAGCENATVTSTIERQIASAYFSLKNYVPSQYGQIGDIKWISTGYRGNLRQPKEFPQIFGGDIFISRFSKKIKHPLFRTSAMDLAPRTPFNYSIEKNVGVPRFYADFGTTVDSSLAGTIFPDLGTEYNFDCLTGANGTYLRSPSKFYLFYYGIPSFLGESEINSNYRYAREGRENDFYPNTEDFVDWTQETNVPIRQDNKFFYNSVYSKKTLQLGNRSLPIDYDSTYFKKIAYQPNQIFWSLQDSSQTDRFEPWTSYKPLDFYQFDADRGKLIDLADIESEQVIGRFENSFLRFNTIDVLRERITPETQELGTGGIFAKRPLEFKKTKLGYGGTQHVDMVSCEYGHFWADAKRGQIFNLDQNGEQLKDITEGITRWLKEQLPFKILSSGIENLTSRDIDNNFKGLGLSMGWDSKYKRVFLTKLDKKLREGQNVCYNDGQFFAVENQAQVIAQYEALGYTFTGYEQCGLNFSKLVSSIGSDTDIHVVYDTTGSFTPQARQQLRAVVQDWFDNRLPLISPGYEGNLYQTDAPSTSEGERWLAYPQYIISEYSDAGIDPSQKDAILISFCNEANPPYHGTSFNGTITAPTADYLEDLASFQAVASQLNSFKGVAYPIVFGTQPTTKENLLHTIAAIYGTVFTPEQADEFSAPNPAFTNLEWTALKAGLSTANPYPDAGLNTMGWTGKYDRLWNSSSGQPILTIEQFSTDMLELLTIEDPETEEITIEPAEIGLDNDSVFEDVSWTIAYSPQTQSWISYYSFTPNYYVSQQDYFQTGLNFGEDKGVWSHLLTNRSYRVFYGKINDWVVESPVKASLTNKILGSLEFTVDSERFHNEYDSAPIPKIGFDELVVYNATNNSGRVKMIAEEKNNLFQKAQYPRVQAGYEEVLATKYDDVFKVNYFYNRVKDENSNRTVWIKDNSDVIKNLDITTLTYTRPLPERMRGNWFLVRYYKTSDSNIHSVYKFNVSREAEF